MVGDKMAKKLIDSIGDILGTPHVKKQKFGTKDEFEVEEVLLPSGEKKSVIVQNEEDDDSIVGIKTKQTDTKPKLSPAELDEDDEDEGGDDKILDAKEMMSELSRQIKEVSNKMSKMLAQDDNNRVSDQASPKENPISLDPRSDLSDQK